MIFFLYFLKNQRPTSRFAISVNSKIGNSVQRNYIKRKMKEWFRLKQLTLDGHVDLWVSIKQRFDQDSAPAVARLFEEALLKVSGQK